MDGNAKVSVIVPVYNVEKYLNKCVQSILNQTYRNIELILIDDGSTDKSGEICDEYLNVDDRVNVIHQKNQGLAETRNNGIRNATGEFCLFVDSDDWIDYRLIELCYTASLKNNADVVCFNFLKEYSRDSDRKIKLSDRIKVFTTEEALENIFFSQYIDVIVCNKFYRKRLFEGIRYPQGKIYEDAFTTYKVLGNARNVVWIDAELYHYYQNCKSIGHSSFSDSTYDIEMAVNECADYISDRIGGISEKLKVGIWYRKMYIVNSMILSKKINVDYIRTLQNEININLIASCDSLSYTRKVQLVMFKQSFGLYCFVYRCLKVLGMGRMLVRND